MRWIRTISIWLLIAGVLIILFEIFQHRFDHSSVIQAAIMFVAGLAGIVWSWLRKN
jgi:Co/Zn/Cd efflux system component